MHLLLSLVLLSCATARLSAQGTGIRAADQALAAEDWAAAVQALTPAIEANPTALGLLQQRGRAHRELGRYAEALADYDRIVRADPAFAPAYAGRAAVRFQMREPEAALPDIARARELGLDDPQLDLLEGMALITSGRGRDAIAPLDRAVKAAPTVAPAWYFRGLARSAAGDDTGAIADFTEAIKLEMPGAEPYAYRAQSRLRAGDRKGACRDITVAAERGDAKASELMVAHCR